MVHVTTAIGLGLAFLLKAMVWSVAPIIGLVIGVAIIAGALLMRFLRARK